MRNFPQRKINLFASLLVAMSLPCFSLGGTVFAQETVSQSVDQSQHLDQASLDNILAPIALYPDSLLSQILVAATYPLEVIKASRWRQANEDLTERQVLAEVESKNWDPSVKALAPYKDLLERISADLDWLQQLGDAFLVNQEQVLSSVQNLRQKAQENSSIANNDYYQVEEEDGNIIIKSTSREIVYVPYYDTRAVYGRWWWGGHQPTYWHRPSSHYRLHAGFYWSDRFYVRPSIFFGGFRWSDRHLVVNSFYYDRPYQYQSSRRTLRRSDYRRWSHNSAQRRATRYYRSRANFGKSGRSVGIKSRRVEQSLRGRSTKAIQRDTKRRIRSSTGGNRFYRQNTTANRANINRNGATQNSVKRSQTNRDFDRRNNTKSNRFQSSPQKTVNRSQVNSQANNNTNKKNYQNSAKNKRYQSVAKQSRKSSSSSSNKRNFRKSR